MSFLSLGVLERARGNATKTTAFGVLLVRMEWKPARAATTTIPKNGYSGKVRLEEKQKTEEEEER